MRKIYTDKDLANDLLLMLKQNRSPTEISKIAHEIYIKHDDGFSDYGRDSLMALIAMNEGDEFIIPIVTLKEMITKLLE
ncbi:MAG: hypothetical protein HQK50_14110 [Oligoflexia bacterium]|nr:hypothetical protein [Oligoflexia bacterium]